MLDKTKLKGFVNKFHIPMTTQTVRYVDYAGMGFGIFLGVGTPLYLNHATSNQINAYQSLESSIENVIISSSGTISLENLQSLQKQTQPTDQQNKRVRNMDEKLKELINSYSKDQDYQQHIKQELLTIDDNLGRGVVISEGFGLLGYLAGACALWACFKTYKSQKKLYSKNPSQRKQ